MTLPSDPPAGRHATAWRVALAVYWAILLLGTHLPAAAPIATPLVGVDKPVHFAAYFVLATLLFQAARSGGKLGWRTRLGLAAIALVSAAADELTQPLVNRTCDLYDWWADAAGVALAVVVDRLRNGRSAD